jgi:hypothetical protein
MRLLYSSLLLYYVISWVPLRAALLLLQSGCIAAWAAVCTAQPGATASDPSMYHTMMGSILTGAQPSTFRRIA